MSERFTYRPVSDEPGYVITREPGDKWFKLTLHGAEIARSIFFKSMIVRAVGHSSVARGAEVVTEHPA